MTSRVPAVGQRVPDVTAKNQFGADVSLSQCVTRGWALVVFYPFAFTGICTGELTWLQAEREQFGGRGVHLLGVSCDAMFTQRAWAEREGFDIDLLSDFWPHGRLARTFGVFDEDAGHAVRGTFLVDDGLTLRWSLVNEPGQARSFTGALDAVDDAAGARG